MLDVLATIYDEGGPLQGVRYARLDGEPKSVTAVGARRESVPAVRRANPDSDTLDASRGSLTPDAGEALVEASESTPWQPCIGLGVCWAWRLTNQQGYADGARLEFSDAGEASRAFVELVVTASAIQTFTAAPSGAA